MERLSDILASIRERAANPFFVSFILSWLAVNWEIPVALFWPDLSQMQSLHYNTIFEYIQFILSKPDSFWWPVGLAAGYTVLSPIIWNGLRWFNAWAIKWGNKIVFDMSKESNVSTEKYLELRENLKKNSDTISEMINTENERLKLHDATKSEFAELQKRNVKLESDYQDQIKSLTSNNKIALDKLNNQLLIETNTHKKVYDISIIEGDWNTQHGKVTIQGRNFIIENDIIGVINLFNYDLKSNIQFVIIRVTENNAFPYSTFYNLNKISNDHWQGQVNEETAVFIRDMD